METLPNNMIREFFRKLPAANRNRLAQTARTMRRVAEFTTPDTIHRLQNIFHEVARATIHVTNVFETRNVAPDGLRMWRRKRGNNSFNRHMDVTRDGTAYALMTARPIGHRTKDAHGSVDIVTANGKEFTLEIYFDQNQGGKGGKLTMTPRYPAGGTELARLAYEAVSSPELLQRLQWRRFKSEWISKGITVEFA